MIMLWINLLRNIIQSNLAEQSPSPFFVCDVNKFINIDLFFCSIILFPLFPKTWKYIKNEHQWENYVVRYIDDIYKRDGSKNEINHSKVVYARYLIHPKVVLLRD